MKYKFQHRRFSSETTLVTVSFGLWERDILLVQGAMWTRERKSRFRRLRSESQDCAMSWPSHCLDISSLAPKLGELGQMIPRFVCSSTMWVPGNPFPILILAFVCLIFPEDHILNSNHYFQGWGNPKGSIALVMVLTEGTAILRNNLCCGPGSPEQRSRRNQEESREEGQKREGIQAHVQFETKSPERMAFVWSCRIL